ncbi:hypothetical protein AY599_18240 [Leptolyngbya valderiana BDU 20041]|nr:hypothetical protein AY599_18240 [Leptolyngbya valderiana BDU 20041]
MIAALAKPLLARLRGVLVAGVTLPVWLMLAIGLWLYVDRGSAVRTAVDAAVTELVAGAEIAGLEARIAALETLNAEEAGRAMALEQANARFADQLGEAMIELDNANDEIAELLARPVDADCRVDDGLAERLRNR